MEHPVYFALYVIDFPIPIFCGFIVNLFSQKIAVDLCTFETELCVWQKGKQLLIDTINN